MESRKREKKEPPSEHHTSIVWAFFELDEENKTVICTRCNRTFAYHGSTTNMLGHLDKKHRFDLTREMNTRKNPDSTGQAHITNYIPPKTHNELLIELIVDANLPLSFVENQKFKNYVKALNPDEVVPSVETLHAAIERYADQYRKELKLLLKEIQAFSVVADLWTSKAKDPYLGVIIQWIDHKWELRTMNLALFNLEYPHKHERIGEALQNFLNEYEITNKCAFLETDGDKKMQGILPLQHIQHFQCGAHLLQLSVKKIMKENEKIISQISEIMAFFRNSPKNLQALRKLLQGTEMEGLKPSTDCPTRWTSTYGMVQKFRRIRPFIKTFLHGMLTSSLPQERKIGKELQDLWIEDFQESYLYSLEKLLEPFNEATETLQGENYVTISSLYPIIHMIKTSLQSITDTELGKLGNSILSDLENRWTPYESDIVFATLLDNRGRFLHFLEQSQAVSFKTHFSEFYQKKEEERQSEEVVEKQLGNLTIQKTSGNQMVSSKIFPNPPPTPEVKTSFDAELERYLLDSNYENDPLKWWKLYHQIYPILSENVKKYLCIPATSASVERLFSIAGNIINEHRTSLSPRIAENLIFLKYWYNLAEKIGRK